MSRSWMLGEGDVADMVDDGDLGSGFWDGNNDKPLLLYTRTPLLLLLRILISTRQKTSSLRELLLRP